MASLIWKEPVMMEEREGGGLPGLPPLGDEETSEQSQCDFSEVWAEWVIESQL